MSTASSFPAGNADLTMLQHEGLVVSPFVVPPQVCSQGNERQGMGFRLFLVVERTRETEIL